MLVHNTVPRWRQLSTVYPVVRIAERGRRANDLSFRRNKGVGKSLIVDDKSDAEHKLDVKPYA
jgi:hypothetical protein